MNRFNNFNSKIRNVGSISRKSLLLIAIVVLALIGLSFWYITSLASKGGSTQMRSEKVIVEKSFDLNGVSGKQEKRPLKATLKNVVKTNSLKINNRQSTLKSGSSYVVLTLTIENNTNERLIFPTSDYIRFIDTNNKRFAPSISQKSVIVEPQATKIDTVGFVEPENIKSMKFAIGSLDGDKEIIEVKFTK